MTFPAWTTAPAAIAIGFGALLATPAPGAAAEHLLANPAQAMTVYSSGYKAQTFTATQSGLLTGVDLQLSRSPEQPTTDTFGVGLEPAHPTTGYPLYGVAVFKSVRFAEVPSLALGVPWTPVSVDLTSGMVELQAGRQYAIKLSATVPGSPPALVWASTDADTYAGGRMFNDPRTSANANFTPIGQGQHDAGFAVRVDPTRRVAEGSVTLTPIYDVAAAAGAGGAFELTDGASTIETRNDADAGVDRRGLLGFDLSSLPTGADITSISLSLDVESSTAGAGGLKNLRVYGFADDGAADAEDAARFDEHIVSTRWFGNAPDPLVLGAGAAGLAGIDRLLAESRYLGLIVTGVDDGTELGFATSESAATSPTLTLSYRYITSVPEPTTAALAALGCVATVTGRPRRR